jgi:hypothetical protein
MTLSGSPLTISVAAQTVALACKDRAFADLVSQLAALKGVASYSLRWEPPSELSDQWAARRLSSLRFFSRLIDELPKLSVEQIEARIEWWWRGENRDLRNAMEQIHRTRCERGKGILTNLVTGERITARCKSWRDCSYCAWVYGSQVERLFKQVPRLRAFVVFTMPSELGDPFNKDHLRAQMKGLRRLAERLFRKFGHRFSTLWTREHNTKRGGPGRLHLNVLWDEEWVDQAWLSSTAAACGFGEVVDISRVGGGGRHALRSGRGCGQAVERYATKCLRYASKDLATQADWPKSTRRWGASRAARAQMKRPDRNPDWFFSLREPPHGFLPGDFSRYRRLRPDELRSRGFGCVCADFVACACGAFEQAGSERVPLKYAERSARARASP